MLSDNISKSSLYVLTHRKIEGGGLIGKHVSWFTIVRGMRSSYVRVFDCDNYVFTLCTRKLAYFRSNETGFGRYVLDTGPLNFLFVSLSATIPLSALACK